MKPLVVNVVELLRTPGSSKAIHTTVRADELGIDDDRVEPDDEIDVSVRLDALSDGVVVAGTIVAPWHDECRRCLTPIDARSDIGVEEIYKVHPDDQSFAIVADQIDLAPMARELVVLGLPMAPLCRPDCVGICPVCGIDQNIERCGCAPAAPEGRWAALDVLRGRLD